jgi:hypothetical protein
MNLLGSLVISSVQTLLLPALRVKRQPLCVLRDQLQIGGSAPNRPTVLLELFEPDRPERK